MTEIVTSEFSSEKFIVKENAQLRPFSVEMSSSFFFALLWPPAENKSMTSF